MHCCSWRHTSWVYCCCTLPTAWSAGDARWCSHTVFPPHVSSVLAVLLPTTAMLNICSSHCRSRTATWLQRLAVQFLSQHAALSRWLTVLDGRGQHAPLRADGSAGKHIYQQVVQRHYIASLVWTHGCYEASVLVNPCHALVHSLLFLTGIQFWHPGCCNTLLAKHLGCGCSVVALRVAATHLGLSGLGLRMVSYCAGSWLQTDCGCGSRMLCNLGDVPSVM